jgi:hypothetical protein
MYEQQDIIYRKCHIGLEKYDNKKTNTILLFRIALGRKTNWCQLNIVSSRYKIYLITKNTLFILLMK